MDSCLLRLLRCPFCGGQLTVSHRYSEDGSAQLSYGILRCHCSRWPVVDGIPIFRKDAVSSTDELLALIGARRYDSALKSCLSIPVGIKYSIKNWISRNRCLRSLPGIRGRVSDVGRLEQLSDLQHPENQIKARDCFNAYFLKANNLNAYHYNIYRVSQPRYLVALSMMNIIRQPNRPLLDLACGSGHTTHALLRRAAGQPVVGVDKWFFGLYMAKHYVAPAGRFVCCEADKRLPFPDGTFAAAVCSDAFHYLVSKLTCIRECERMTKDSGFFLLIWLRNAQVRVPYDGFPLPAEGYQGLVSHMTHRILADRSILARYLGKKGPCLADHTDVRQLACEPTVSLIASHRAEILRDYGPLGDWPHADGRLSLNPLYVRERLDSSGRLSLRRIVPSAFFGWAHPEINDYLPDRVDIPTAILEDLVMQKRTADIERLIATFVIMGLPEAYS